MTSVADLLRGALTGGSPLALPLAMFGGLAAGLNPCCLPLYPAAAATCCAARDERLVRSLGNSAAFVAGMALSTSLLGVVAAVGGRALMGLGGWPRYLVAIVPLAIGALALGWVRVPLPRFAPRARAGALGALFAGMVLSLVIAPCGTPVLASVLGYAALRGSMAYGTALLFSYGLGAGLPILFAGAALGRLAAWLDGRGWRRWVDRVTGATAIGVGFYLLWVV